MKFLLSILLFPFRLVWWVIRFLLMPFTWLFSKLFGPPPLTMGGPPVDHSTPELLPERTGIKGQVLYILISIFCVVAVAWAVTAEVDEQVGGRLTTDGALAWVREDGGSALVIDGSRVRWRGEDRLVLGEVAPLAEVRDR